LDQEQSKTVYQLLQAEEIEEKSGIASVYKTPDSSSEIYCTLHKLTAEHACTISINRDAPSAKEAVYFDSILLATDELLGERGQELYEALAFEEVPAESDGD
jgi:hypothetical protein